MLKFKRRKLRRARGLLPQNDHGTGLAVLYQFVSGTENPPAEQNSQKENTTFQEHDTTPLYYFISPRDGFQRLSA
ncbi:hypothetical protein SDC9_196524 [bioreactor metagenome]|uniref:Uncharacterized protein n=1 Tax=bioreactor metagenome TaxID=1076179 RepID=A0A645IC29_9ZZZZ